MDKINNLLELVEGKIKQNILQISSLKRELEILRKKHTTSEKAAIQAAEVIQVNKNAKKNLVAEAQMISHEIEIDKDKIVTVMKEKERFENE